MHIESIPIERINPEACERFGRYPRAPRRHFESRFAPFFAAWDSLGLHVAARA